MNRLEVSLSDGKYTVIQNADGALKALRYGEEWQDLTGNNLVLALAHEVDRLRDGLKILKVAVNDKQPDPGAVNFIAGLLRE